VHEPATDCLAILGRKAAEACAVEADAGLSGSKTKESLVAIWERGVKETMAAKGSRGKLQAIKTVLLLRNSVKGSLKPWLAPMVDLLEDGDGQVREAAREVSTCGCA
jgi:CLIP-associating protein 1/2